MENKDIYFYLGINGSSLSLYNSVCNKTYFSIPPNQAVDLFRQYQSLPVRNQPTQLLLKGIPEGSRTYKSLGDINYT